MHAWVGEAGRGKADKSREVALFLEHELVDTEHTHTKTDLNVKVKFQLTFNNYIFIGGFTLEYTSC